MARYTVTIHSLRKINFDFGLNAYPIFEESYRATLNKNILDFYEMSEIGFETTALFKHHLNNTMSIIMPMYNKKYETMRMTIDPLKTIDFTETHTQTTAETVQGETGTTTGTTDTTTNVSHGTNSASDSSTRTDDTTATTVNTKTGTTSDSKTLSQLNYQSDTPNGMLNPNDVEQNLYITKADKNTSSETGGGTHGETTNDSVKNTGTVGTVGVTASTNDTTATINGSTTGTAATTAETTTSKTVTDTITRTGYEDGKTAAEKLLELQSLFSNVDYEIIMHPEIKNCFMQVY